MSLSILFFLMTNQLILMCQFSGYFELRWIFKPLNFERGNCTAGCKWPPHHKQPINGRLGPQQKEFSGRLWAPSSPVTLLSQSHWHKTQILNVTGSIIMWLCPYNEFLHLHIKSITYYEFCFLEEHWLRQTVHWVCPFRSMKKKHTDIFDTIKF